MKLIIVSGLSGSGKSIALDTLEDSGYYCIDNLPVALVEKLIEQVIGAENPTYRKIAIGIDSRTDSKSLATFPEILSLIKSLNIEHEILFLQADPKTLLKRFSETRRKHPLTNADLSLTDAIHFERKLLEPVIDHANLIIDTSRTNIHELRELVRVRVGLKKSQVLSIFFQSFGFKNGIPLDTDFVFDARCLPNPHWEPALRGLTGKDRPVIEFLDNMPVVREYLGDLTRFLQRWLPDFEAGNRSYFSIAIGCTGGRHRSVYLAENLANNFRSTHYHILVGHRELH
ncbi:MAG: RNase adapter RapZ [Gammaproteobacteria bacterium]